MEQEIIHQLEEIKENARKAAYYNKLAAKNVLDISDVSALTGMSKGTLYRLTSEKKIPHYKPTAKLLYFDRNEIEAWMKQNRVSTQTEAESMAATYFLRKGGVL